MREEGWSGAPGGLGGEGELDAAGGVALVAGRALQAAVVVQVAGAGCALAVQLSMGELDAFHVHLNLCCAPGRRDREKSLQDVPPPPLPGPRWSALVLTLVRVGVPGAEGGAHAVRAYPLPLRRACRGRSAAAAPQELQLTLEVPLLALQRIQLVLALLICLFKFLVEGGRQREGFRQGSRTKRTHLGTTEFRVIAESHTSISDGKSGGRREAAAAAAATRSRAMHRNLGTKAWRARRKSPVQAASLTFMCALALLSRPRVVWRLQSGPRGMRPFNRSRHSRR